MNRIWTFLRGLDWRVLLALPVLSVLLGVANNWRVSEDQRVRWSGAPIQDVMVAADEVGAQRGVWTSDFAAATNAAAAAHVPVVVVVTQKGCDYCKRLHKAVTGVAVKAWLKERGWYFVLADREECPAAYELTVATPVALNAAPYVGVYWTRADGTQAMRNFPGRAGKMGVRKENTLALEWMRALEAAVPDAPGIKGGASATSIVRQAKMHFSVATKLENGAGGQVKTSPAVTSLKEGQKVVLTAVPKKGSVFVGWRYPNGHLVYGKRRLALAAHYPEGTYKAVFRRLKDCAAPVLRLPEQELVWKERQFEKLTLRVNADAHPVTFSCEDLPPGIFLNSISSGALSGRPLTNGVWQVKVTARGVFREQPVATGTFTIRVLPSPHPEDAADEEQDGPKEDDEVD